MKHVKKFNESINNNIKDESLEEAAQNYSKQFDYAEDSSSIIDFKEGAKWQLSRSYTENEVKGMLYEVGSAMRYKGVNYQSYYNC